MKKAAGRRRQPGRLALGRRALGRPPPGDTTSPGYNFTINVTLTDTSVVLSRVGREARLARTLRDHQQGHEDPRVRHRRSQDRTDRRRQEGASSARYLDDRGQYTYKVDGKIRGYFTVV